jgi:hypothetical protein
MPMNQYIITEEELLDTRSYIYHEDEEAFIKIERNVRSHPYQSERKKMLDELKEWAITGFNKDVVKIPVKTLLFKLAELRQAGEP